jgi:DNA-directed RNA polymerase subunit RPC12/RpoP
MFNAKKGVPNSKNSRSPCQQCGALLAYQPGTQRLVCQYCSHTNMIEDRLEAIQEYDLHHALIALANAKPANKIQRIKCESCGAGFKFAESVSAGECPFCGTSIMVESALDNPINPKSLLPFTITQEQARQQFRVWLKGLWFVPAMVKKYADEEASLQGIYIPYWTYDSQTETLYQGARGRVHYVNERVRTYESRRLVGSTRKVPKVEWTPAQGKVIRFFDDVLIEANKSLPRQILERLQPWDLENLVPYNESYLSGFACEFYQVGLDEGFDEAKSKMDNLIYQDMAVDIGGDEQRIDRYHTQHHNTTFKHCLLPVWSAAYCYRKKTYRFLINGRTGKVQGEKPYSKWKIGFAILGVIVLIGLLMTIEITEEPEPAYDDEQNTLEEAGQQP